MERYYSSCLQQSPLGLVPLSEVLPNSIHLRETTQVCLEREESTQMKILFKTLNNPSGMTL